MSDQFADQPPGATPLNDISGLLNDSVFTREDLDEVETENIYRAEEWLASARIKDVFTVDFYRTLHCKMFEDVWDWAGILRTETCDQVGEPFVRAEMVSAELGRVAMEYYREWDELVDDEPILPFLARYHHALVLVHPFNNGNGRWSRLATDAVLMFELDQGPLEWGIEEGSLNVDSQERDDYIEALRCADDYDFEALIAYLAEFNEEF